MPDNITMKQFKIIGNRAGQTSVNDVVTIFCGSVRFDMQNPILALPIPSTGNTTIPVTKLINLRRVLYKVIVQGEIVDTTYSNLHLNIEPCAANVMTDGSARNVSFTDSTGALSYASATPVKRVVEKKWILEQFALAGANSGKGLTIHWRGQIDPADTTDYFVNKFTEKAFISALTITDEASNQTLIDTNSPVPVGGTSCDCPARMVVNMTLVVGDPTQ